MELIVASISQRKRRWLKVLLTVIIFGSIFAFAYFMVENEWDSNIGNIFVFTTLLVAGGFLVYTMFAHKCTETGTIEISSEGLKVASDDRERVIPAEEIERISVSFSGYGEQKWGYLVGTANVFFVRLRDKRDFSCMVLLLNHKEKKKLRKALEDLGEKGVTTSFVKAEKSMWKSLIDATTETLILID